MKKITYFVGLFFFLSTALLGQEISIQAVSELTYSGQKGVLRLPLSNYGGEPLHILDLKSSHPDAIELQLSKNPILPTHLAFLHIQYDFTATSEKGAKIIILQTNAQQNPKISIELVAAKKDQR